jgi:hypothetical protein
MVNLVADHEITEAAQAIDAEVWPVHLQIRNGMTADGDWYALRDKVEARRRDFVNIARKRLSSAGPPLRRRTGRPAPEDPIWHSSPDRQAEADSASYGAEDAAARQEQLPRQTSA